MPFPSLSTWVVIIVGIIALGMSIFYTDFGLVGLLIAGLYALVLYIRRCFPGNCPSCRRKGLAWTFWENGGDPGSLLALFRGWNYFNCHNCGRQWKTRVIGMRSADNRAFSIQPVE
jgi:hypothetical protein